MRRDEESTAQELVALGPLLPTLWSQTSSHQSMEHLLYVILRRRWLILALFVAFGVAAAVTQLARPPVRSGVAKILLKADRVSLQISSLAPQTAKVPNTTQALKAELEMIESRDVLLPVAEKILTEGGMAKDAPEFADAAWRLAVSLGDKLLPVAKPDTSVIELRYFAQTEAEAVKNLKLIVDQYLEHHAMAYGGSAELLKFYEQEKARARDELEAAEDALREWQQNNKVISVEDQVKALFSLLTAQQQALQEAKAGRQTTRHGNPILTALNQQLSTKQVELNELKQRYTDNDRNVKEKQEQVFLIQKQIAEADRVVGASLASQTAALQTQIRETNEELERLRTQKVDGERLARAVELSRDTFLLYGKKVEEARISSKLDKEGLSNLAIIERPHAAGTDDLIERIGSVALASMVGLTLGAALAFGLAFFNKALRTRRDVESYLGLPVLAVIPDLRTQPLLPRPVQ
jgi:uncharacterized protein involved in exopolysaccharide biosynthesis